jgi:hypothetical protein
MHEINYVWEAEDLLCVPLLWSTGGGRLDTAVGGDCGEMIRGAGRCSAVSGETGNCRVPTVGLQLSSEVSETLRTTHGASNGR